MKEVVMKGSITPQEISSKLTFKRCSTVAYFFHPLFLTQLEWIFTKDEVDIRKIAVRNILIDN